MDIFKINNVDEIDVLLGRSAKVGGFEYKYDQETIDLLKRNFAMEGSLYLMAEEGGEFVGFCSIDRDWWEEGWFFLREIFVEMEFHGRGVGEKLMKKCLAHAKENGAVGVVTETGFENVPMQRLCEKLGFEKWDNPQWGEGVTYKVGVGFE